MNMLHVILLENDNIIVHKSDAKYDYEIMNECIENYEFAKINKPVLFLERIPITENLDIDECVKHYMQYYGFEHVRGGSYMNVSNEQYHELMKEFSKKDAALLLDDLKYFVHENTRYTIDRTIINSIQWLMDAIQIKYNIYKYNETYPNTMIQPITLFFSEHGVNEYKNLMIALNAICKKNVNPKMECKYPDYIKNPSVFFESLFFSNEEIPSDDMTIAKSVCDYFEYLTYCIINKYEELEFDLSNNSDNL
jgi:hypothetical protein